MEQYSVFIFDKVLWNPYARTIVLRYSLDRSMSFEETLILPSEQWSPDLKSRQPQIDQALRALHLIGGISYYKTCLPKEMDLGDITLNKAEATFWNTVYERGLGEFFYRNNIDFRGLINFPSLSCSPKTSGTMNQKPETRNLKRILVPIGGGKDSLVTIELLKKSGAKITLFRMGSHPLITELAHSAGLPMLTVRRSIAGNLFDLNEQGAFNGHVPITAYLSILSVLIALLYDFDAIALSCERSANEGNVIFKEMEINHQWSKSLEFEKMLRVLIRESIGSNIEYFSALRPYSELKIAELFSGMPQYFEHVTSCNTNWKIIGSGKWTPRRSLRSSAGQEVENARPDGVGRGKWCNRCPKCAFVFACLAAFLSRATLQKMFGAILFDNDWLVPLYRELLGTANFKPFECVGTPEETRAAFLLARRKGAYRESAVMKMFEKEVLPLIKDPEALIAEALAPSKQHCIPHSLSDPMHHATFHILHSNAHS